MIGPTSDDKKIAKIIVANISRTKEVNDLEPDFEDAKDAAFEEFMDAIHAKDKSKLKSSFLAILEMCKDEENYEPDETIEA